LNPSSEIALQEYVQEQLGKPFEFGYNDCPLFVAGAIDAMKGTELRDKYTGLWHSQASAWKYAKKNGDLSEQLKKLGFKTVELSHIQTGDVIVMEQRLAHEKKWRSVAVCIGSKVAIVRDDIGVEIVNIFKVPNITEVLRWQ
jgi:ribosomal protein L27